MSVKPPSSLLERVLERLSATLLSDWWIDAILMLFIVLSMLHFNL